MSAPTVKTFATETKKILELFAKWLYRDKEIFLRELVSNASDALDKLKILALENTDLYDAEESLGIKVLIDKEAKTVTVLDNGIGMDMDEVVTNLGTIAKSGTTDFIEKMQDAPQNVDKGSLIGQFGVGFYSAFVVSDKVTVQTRRADKPASEGVFWESTGEDEYKVEQSTIAARGTQITMHLKEDAMEFLEAWRLRKIITTYSDHISFPITMMKEQVKESEEKTEDKDQDKTPENQEKEWVEEVVNQANALWKMPKSQIKDEEYENFYKQMGHDFNSPLAWTHNRVEGRFDYTSLLYIPAQAPFDLWNRDYKRGLKLYVQRVFILDDAENLLPSYLRFVKGLVDSNDLPLNVSREVLQSSETVDTIKSSCVKRILDLLEYLAESETEKYAKFWETFGAVLKEGPGEDHANKDRIVKLLRFATTKHSDKQSVSFADYVGRMLEGQDKIYYVVAESKQAAMNSPHLELFNKRGIEVMVLHERIDEWLLSRLTEFEGKKLVSISRGDVDLGDLGVTEAEKEAHKEAEKSYEDILKRVEKSLDGRVKLVRITERLTDSPSCVVADDDDMSANLKRMLKEAGQAVPESKPILELNPHHALVERLKEETSDDKFANLAEILLGQAILAEGGTLENPSAFVKQLNGLLIKA
ncbi:MAG: molecular chaperone HtpG [Pseudomonadota bacterium]|nr:molecular chaperone HtpG [Pseudomonadota bacterium]